MSTYEEKFHSYANYLRNRLFEKDMVPREALEDLSDEELLESYRINHTDGSPLYSKEQEHQAIMENEGNEGIFNATENLKHMNHIEEVEKNLLKKYADKIHPITAAGNKDIEKALKALNKDREVMSMEDVDGTILCSASTFPEYIIQGEEYAPMEESEGAISILVKGTCTGCMMEDNFSRFKTLFPWAISTMYGETKDEEDEQGFKTYMDVIQEHFFDHFFTVIQGNLIEIDPEMNTNKWLEDTDNEVNELIGAIMHYLSKITIPSCWVYAKEKAQEKIQHREESGEVLQNIHNIFHEKYELNYRNNNIGKYLKEVKDFLRTLTFEQVAIVQENGFPVDMSKNWANRTEEAVEEVFDEKCEKDENTEIPNN